MSNRTIRYLKDYQPPSFAVDYLELFFNLQEDKTRVSSKMRLRKLKADTELLRLDGIDLKLTGLFIDGRRLAEDEYQQDEESLQITRVPDVFTLAISTEIYPDKNTVLMGLYRSSRYFVTQCEPEGFRRITYFFDRPDVLTCYKTTIEADKKTCPVLLSNGNCVAQGEADGGRHWVTWEDPFNKPSYLFALVAGDLACLEKEFITSSKQSVKLQVYAEQKDIAQCDYALTCLQQAMQWDEQTYGREYDLERYMIVAVSDFNMGAMENKGLNVFNTKYVLVDPHTATDQDFQNVQSVIGHEYFHNWSGNRVTCRDWFQLSLKEGLTIFRDQTFSADLNSAAVKRIQDVRVLQTVQFAEDHGPMAHPVQPDSYMEINNFYTVTVYNKGAEVIRMIRTLIGVKAFRKGMDEYFEDYDGQAVTINEFVAAMEEASDYELTQFRRWYHQAGTPKVQITDHYEADQQRYTLSLKQTATARDSKQQKPFHIPIKMALIDAKGTAVSASNITPAVRSTEIDYLLELTSEQQDWIFEGVQQKPVPSLLHGFSAPIKWHYEYSEEQLALLLQHAKDPFARWFAGQQLMLRTILACIETYQAKQSLSLQPQLLQAVRHILEALNHDEALLAELLSLPSERYIAECVTVVDPEAIHAAHEFVQISLANELYPLWLQVYQARCQPTDYQVNAEAMGRRRLKNLCLGYLLKTQKTEEIARGYRQYQQANNMTDRMAAFSLLAHSEVPERLVVLEDFYAQWKESPLVLDKWFSVQAVSPLRETAERVKAFLDHPDFVPTNPNRVRALLGVFVHNNPAHFHAAGGHAYRWVTDQIIKLDSLNPHTATSLVSVFNPWRRFDVTRQALMQAELERILNTPKLSKDVYEIVSRSLESH